MDKPEKKTKTKPKTASKAKKKPLLEKVKRKKSLSKKRKPASKKHPLLENAKPGRPSLLTSARKERLLSVIREGGFQIDAACEAGICKGTFNNWVLKGTRCLDRYEASEYLTGEERDFAEFVLELRQARAAATTDGLKGINAAGLPRKMKDGTQVPGDWKALAWRVSHGPGRDNWGDKTEVSGPGGGPIEVADARQSLRDKLERVKASVAGLGKPESGGEASDRSGEA